MVSLEVETWWRAMALITGSTSPATLNDTFPSAAFRVADARQRRQLADVFLGSTMPTVTVRRALLSRSAIRSTAISLPARTIPTRSQMRSTSSSS